MTFDTREFVWEKSGEATWRWSIAIRFKAALSKTTTQSAWFVRRFRVKRELYGCTTTSLLRREQQQNNKAFRAYHLTRFDLGKHCTFAEVFSHTDRSKPNYHVRMHSLRDSRQPTSNRYDPIPDPVPPAIEWQITKPARLSLPSTSRSIISINSS
jgi:hypothetical protein